MRTASDRSMRTVGAGAALIILLGSSTSAAAPTRWMQPVYRTTPAVQKEITATEHYTYRVAEYQPPVTIQAVPKPSWRWTTPEEAMISRTSAMMISDYDAFMAAWDPASRAESVQSYGGSGQTEEKWLQQWKEIFAIGRMVMTRRIDTGEYAIITYRVLTFDGQDVGGGLELPTVFVKNDGRWAATQALKRDPLVLQSPWVSGQDQIERTVP